MINVHWLWRKHKRLGNSIDLSSDSEANTVSREVPNYRQHWQQAHMNLYSNNTSVLSTVLAPDSSHLIVCVVPKHFYSAGRKDSFWR